MAWVRGRTVEILYWSAGLFIYLFLITLITKIFGHNNIDPDRRKMDRRLSTEERRKSQRNAGGDLRRVKERRSPPLIEINA